MGTFIAILNLLPVILTTVKAIEAEIPLPASGKAKLDLVLGAVTDTFAATQQIEAGGMSRDKMIALLSQTVTRVVATLNALGVFKSSGVADTIATR